MRWTVNYKRAAEKQLKKLSDAVQSVAYLLRFDLENNGPFPGDDWPNYSKLKGQKGDKRHCHLIKGTPTYVCCWEVVCKTQKVIEVYYVGTHEKAPY